MTVKKKLKKRGKNTGISLPDMSAIEGKSLLLAEGKYDVEMSKLSMKSTMIK